MEERQQRKRKKLNGKERRKRGRGVRLRYRLKGMFSMVKVSGQRNKNNFQWRNMIKKMARMDKLLKSFMVIIQFFGRINNMALGSAHTRAATRHNMALNL